MRIFVLSIGLVLLAAASTFSYTVRATLFERELVSVNYGLGMAQVAKEESGTNSLDNEFSETTATGAKRKSPGKAFLYSLIVPGAGQWYNGSKIKAVGFLGIEAASWILYASFHSKGNELTDDFELFSDTHWSEARYSEYLSKAYGQTDDDDIHAVEISHHLPDTKTQQYYEMTGKYDQFSWGWDDATLRDSTLDQFGSGMPPAKNENVPNTNNRQIYEDMRHDANQKFHNATKMIIVASINHVLSALEAMIGAKRYNSRMSSDGLLGGVKVKASLKSIYTKRDTPYVSFSCGF